MAQLVDVRPRGIIEKAVDVGGIGVDPLQLGVAPRPIGGGLALLLIGRFGRGTRTIGIVHGSAQKGYPIRVVQYRAD